MKDIEKRAEEKALRMVHPNSFSRPTTKELLIEMAKEQRKIDIDKACDVYAKELKDIIIILNKVGEMRGIEELGEILSYEGCIRDFRKAMEG